MDEAVAAAKKLSAESGMIVHVFPLTDATNWWDAPVWVIDARSESKQVTSRSLLRLRGKELPDPPDPERCGQIAEWDWCGAAPIAIVGTQVVCDRHLRIMLPYADSAFTTVIEPERYFAALFDHHELPTGAMVQLALADDDGAIRFSSGLIVALFACPLGTLLQDHYRDDGSCLCPDTEK
jgi:hypothetical protein